MMLNKMLKLMLNRPPSPRMRPTTTKGHGTPVVAGPRGLHWKCLQG